MKIRINNRIISETEKPYFIADIAANHDGQIDRAYRLIELAKEAGADAAKFQNFKAETIVSRNGFQELGKQLSHQASWDKSVFEVYQDASLEDEWTILLKKKCDETEIEYMTSPYDFKAVDHAEPFVNVFKIGSGDITWSAMLRYIAKKNKPVFLATGAADICDVKRAAETILLYNTELVLMQCNTNYTADIQNFSYINLNVLKTYQELFPNVLLGLSDHTHGHTAVLGAIALGARVIEKHFTDDIDRIGPDHKFSMTPKEFKAMVAASGQLFEALGDGVKRVEKNELDSQIVQQRAVFLRTDKKAGEILVEKDLIPLRPCRSGAIKPYDMEKLCGKRLKNDVKADSSLCWEDVEDDDRI